MTLDCLGDKLRQAYERFGFVAVAAVQFCDDQAPDGWDYDHFGRPSVYFMAHRQRLPRNISQLESVDLSNLSYNEAYDYRAELIDDVQ